MSLIKAQGAGDASTGFYDYTIDQSLRFLETGDGGSRPYIYRTQGTPTLEKKYTISCWIKIGDGTATGRLIVGGLDNSTGQFPLWLRSDHKIGSYDSDGVSTFFNVYGNSILRDSSAWYHVVLNFDSANSTAASRLRIYINGVEETITGTVPLNRAGYINQSGTVIAVGSSNGSSVNNAWDGHIAEVHFIDGQVKAYTEFGETKNGIWVPKAYSGSYGNNGFYLDFADDSAIGDDESGNGNDFSVSNAASDRVVLDSPTNNHSTFNPNDHEDLLTFSEGNTALAYSGNTNRALARSTIKMPANTDAFFEVKITSSLGSGVDMAIGIEDGTAVSDNDIVVFNNAFIIREDGTFYDQSSAGSYGVSFTNNDVIGVWRKANGDLVFYKNGTAMNSGTPAKTSLTGEFHFVAGPFNGASCIARFASDQWTNAPSGVDATMSLCADNLPDPAIDPAKGEESSDYFNIVLWTGNDVDDRAISGVGFQPDWVWIKNRDVAEAHNLYDVIRGAEQQLYSNSNDDEFDRGVYGLKSFTSDGFTLGTGGEVNDSSEDYVAWNWLAGGSASSNSNGTITSSVSANTEAGVRIVSYTGTGSAGTVGHGLSSAPEMIIQKMRNPSSAENWTVFHKDLTSANYALRLNLSNAQFDGSGNYFSATSSSTFSIGSTSQVNENTKTSIAYCFHSVDGYSSVGSYTGVGSSSGTTGPYVYLGFRPAWIMIKRIDSSGNWWILDKERDPRNEALRSLRANGVDVEDGYSGNFLDFYANGFGVRTSGTQVNASSGKYMYLAFAEQPFKYSNAR